MMYSNEYFSEITLMVNKVSDLPFLAAALFYLGASIKVNLDPEPNKKLDLTLLITGGVIFLAALIVNLVLKDAL